MNVLSEIINSLCDNSNSITSSMMKIKVFSKRINNESLSKWIEKELNGYLSEDELPEYRESGCVLIGSYINGHHKWSNQVLATLSLPSFIREDVESMKFYHSLAVLESYLKDEEMKLITTPILPEAVGLITKTYQENGNPWLTVTSAYKQVHIGAVEHIITEVRNKALDLMLGLEGELGLNIELEELITKKKDVNYIINNIMSKTIINNEGNGNVINTGNENKIVNKNIINKSDFESVKKILEENNVDDSDIIELENIIKTDIPDEENKKFGKGVSDWIGKMVSKAAQNIWNINVGAAGSLLAEALNKYYGWF